MDKISDNYHHRLFPWPLMVVLLFLLSLGLLYVYLQVEYVHTYYGFGTEYLLSTMATKR